MYTPDADDATNPLLSTLAGTAQAEFQAIKQKMNNFFLASSYNSSLMNQGIRAGTTLVIDLPAGTDPGILYGHSVLVTRNDMATSGAQVVGAQINAVLGNDINVPFVKDVSVFGVAIEAWTGPSASQATLIGMESSIISQYHGNILALLGCDIVFKNRPDTLYFDSVRQGLGSNQYNSNSRAIQITSQPSSTAGERCGWHKGIVFYENSFAWAMETQGALSGTVTPAIALDFTNMGNPLVDPGANNPWTAYKISSALALSEFMSITWDKLQDTRTYLDSFNKMMWLFSTGGSASPSVYPTGQLGWDYDTNKLVVNSGLQGPPAAADNSVIMTFSGVDYYVHLTAV